jgi:hypothetical protein
MAGTWGWSDVVVQAEFTSSQRDAAVIAHAQNVVSRLGWKRELVGEPDGTPSVTATWTKSIRSTVPARLTMSNDGPNEAWVLVATATPEGHPVKGC